MSTHLDELKELVAALKADQQTQKDNAKRDAWTKYVSLSTIILAVLAAVATQKSGGYSSASMRLLNEATFNQAQASDQWSYYQAKGIKQNLYELEGERVQAATPDDHKTLDTIAKRVKRYDTEKQEITVKAKGFEAKRDAASAGAVSASIAGREMGLATSIFQISIALGGITLIVKKRWLWYASMFSGLLAVLQMIRVIYGG